MPEEKLCTQEITPSEVIEDNGEKLAKLVKWNLTVNAKQAGARDKTEWLSAQIAGVTTEILGANLPLEMGRTVYSNVNDNVEVEVVPMSDFFETDAAGRTKKAMVLRQAFEESFKGWGKNIQVKEEVNGVETDKIITIRVGMREAPDITNWMVYTPNWKQNLAESTEPKVAYDKWREIENERREKVNPELIAEGKPPYKKIIKSSYTMRDWFDEENERRKIMGKEPLHEPESGVLQEGATMPDALTILKGLREIVGFTEVKGYTFEELQALVISLRETRQKQIIQQQEDRAWENNLDGPITPTVPPEAKIKVGNIEFTAGVNLLGEERMINNLRGLLYGGKVEKTKMVTSILPSSITTGEGTPYEEVVEVKGGKSTDLAERTYAVLRFVEAPEGKTQEYDALLQELGKYITEFGYQNVIIQTLMLNHEQIVEAGFYSLKKTLTTEDKEVKKIAGTFSNAEIKTICEVINLDATSTIAHIRNQGAKKQ